MRVGRGALDAGTVLVPACWPTALIALLRAVEHRDPSCRACAVDDLARDADGEVRLRAPSELGDLHRLRERVGDLGHALDLPRLLVPRPTGRDLDRGTFPEDDHDERRT